MSLYCAVKIIKTEILCYKLPFYIYLKYVFYRKKGNMEKTNNLISHETNWTQKIKSNNSFQFKLVGKGVWPLQHYGNGPQPS